ncbi:hypothetical protein MG293_011029 [Ovis ammon polii]|uniref:Uncharacterized protein n=1 Tax=Ovis ammon polii TaxID=230172 RepID=A0AAD4U5N6_OVIAM|nr:hypothetical protein MG293_011029 [Ovis ammon polii]KAI4565181.1 hypothetical protein MJT46_009524 [Ovis ammon polii x Ovis aries]
MGPWVRSQGSMSTGLHSSVLVMVYTSVMITCSDQQQWQQHPDQTPYQCEETGWGALTVGRIPFKETFHQELAIRATGEKYKTGAETEGLVDNLLMQSIWERMSTEKLKENKIGGPPTCTGGKAPSGKKEGPRFHMPAVKPQPEEEMERPSNSSGTQGAYSSISSY